MRLCSCCFYTCHSLAGTLPGPPKSFSTVFAFRRPFGRAPVLPRDLPKTPYTCISTHAHTRFGGMATPRSAHVLSMSTFTANHFSLTTAHSRFPLPNTIRDAQVRRVIPPPPGRDLHRQTCQATAQPAPRLRKRQCARASPRRRKV
jgi:hypothetical protein